MSAKRQRSRRSTPGGPGMGDCCPTTGCFGSGPRRCVGAGDRGRGGASFGRAAAFAGGGGAFARGGAAFDAAGGAAFAGAGAGGAGATRGGSGAARLTGPAPLSLELPTALGVALLPASPAGGGTAGASGGVATASAARTGGEPARGGAGVVAAGPGPAASASAFDVFPPGFSTGSCLVPRGRVASPGPLLVGAGVGPPRLAACRRGTAAPMGSARARATCAYVFSPKLESRRKAGATQLTTAC